MKEENMSWMECIQWNIRNWHNINNQGILLSFKFNSSRFFSFLLLKKLKDEDDVRSWLSKKYRALNAVFVKPRENCKQTG